MSGTRSKEMRNILVRQIHCTEGRRGDFVLRAPLESIRAAKTTKTAADAIKAADRFVASFKEGLDKLPKR